MSDELKALKYNHLAILDALAKDLDKKKIKLKTEYDSEVSKLKSEYALKVLNEQLRYKNEVEQLKAEIAEKNKVKNKSKDSAKSEKSDGASFYWLLAIPVVILIIGVFLLILSELRPSKSELDIKIGEVETKIRINFNDTFFQTTKLPLNEKVKNKKGDYYKIDLKLAATKELILFPAGKYYLSTDKQGLITSINRFREKVYNYLDKKYETEIYIKGTADIKGDLNFSDTLISMYDSSNGFTRIMIKPLDKTTDKYDTNTVVYNVNKKYKNRDLPNLRAKYVQKIISEGNSDWKTSEILEGNVVNEISETERNAYLILFVNKSEIISPHKKKSLVTGISILLIAIGLGLLIFLFAKRKKKQHLTLVTVAQP